MTSLKRQPDIGEADHTQRFRMQRVLLLVDIL